MKWCTMSKTDREKWKSDFFLGHAATSFSFHHLQHLDYITTEHENDMGAKSKT